MLSKNLIGGLLLLLLIAFGCEPEPAKENLFDKVIGNWDVTQAIRNEKPTTTLEDAYFKFENDKTVILNLDGNDQSATFEMKGKTIKIKGTSLEGDFQILKLQDSSMILSTSKKIGKREYNFIFHMMKTDSSQLESI